MATSGELEQEPPASLNIDTLARIGLGELPANEVGKIPLNLTVDDLGEVARKVWSAAERINPNRFHDSIHVGERVQIGALRAIGHKAIETKDRNTFWATVAVLDRQDSLAGLFAAIKLKHEFKRLASTKLPGSLLAG